MLYAVLWIGVLIVSAAAGVLLGSFLNRFRFPPSQGGDSC